MAALPSFLLAAESDGVSLDQELSGFQIPPDLVPARLEAAGGTVSSDKASRGVPNNFGGCSENDLPIVDNAILQAASRLRASTGTVSYQCLPGFQSDSADKWTVRVHCKFEPKVGAFKWHVNGGCVPLKDDPKCSTVPTPPANARLPELDSVGESMKFVPGARIYFDCVEAFMTTADDGVTPPYSVCTKEGRWTPTKYACKLGQRIVNDAVAKAEELAKSAKEKHVRFFHSDDPAAGDAETEAERLEHDAVIDRFVHLTNSKGLPHNEELHRLVHHGPAANVAGGDIENDFPVPDNVAFKKMAPGGSDFDELPLMLNKAKLRREERTLLALLKKQDEVLHPGVQRNPCITPSGTILKGCMKGFGEEFLTTLASQHNLKKGPKSKKATVRRMRENGVDYTDSQWADMYDTPDGGPPRRTDVTGDSYEEGEVGPEGMVQGDAKGYDRWVEGPWSPKPGYHIGVRNTDGRFEMMPNNPPRLHKYHSTVKADIDRRIRHSHLLGGDSRIVKTPRPRTEHNPYYVLFLVLGTFGFMVTGAAGLINHYGLLDLDSHPGDSNPCPPMPKCASVVRDRSAADTSKDTKSEFKTEGDDTTCGKPWWDFC
jgi:hypothetical protein